MSDRTPETPPADAGDERLGPSAARAAGERLRELAEAEHARAEADELVPEHADNHSVREPELEHEHPLEAAGVEAVTEAALVELGDAAAGYAPCPFCDGYGAVDPDQLLEALPDVIRKLAPYPESTIFVRCSECDGWGNVLTGGRTGDNGIQPCPACGSHGYIDTRDDAAAVAIRGDEGFDGDRHSRILHVDPFTLAPPEGAPPAAGMEWDDAAQRWGYPVRVA